MNTPSPATELLEFLAGLGRGRLPAELAALGTRCVIDNLACGLMGSIQPWGRIVSEHVREEGAAGRATVFGSAHPASPAGAALANGTMIHGFEADDMILGSMSHPGTVVVPAALAMAEHCGASAERLLLGVVAGYEMMARLGTALGVDHSNRGFHTTGIAGPVAAAVAAGIVSGQTFAQVRQAVGIACSCASGIKAFIADGGMTKRLHGGRAAEAGVTASLLAGRGFEGPSTAIDGRFGLLEVIGGGLSRAPILSEGLGQNWAVGRVWIKMWTSCAVIHPALHAIETISKRERLEPASIRTLRVVTTRRAIEQNGERAPRELFGAQYSMPFCVALAAAGNIHDPSAFEGDRLRDPAVLAMIDRVELVADAEFDDAYPARIGARLELETRDGACHAMTVWGAHGTPADPCTDAELEAKFVNLAGAVLTPNAVASAYAAAKALGGGGPIGALSDALRTLEPVRC